MGGAGLAAGVAGVSGCLSQSGIGGGGGGGPIQMGGILPLTGGLANPATWIDRAWKLWRDQVNENGGLLGRQVEFTVYDTELDKSKMRTTAQRLLQQDDVDVFVGPYPTLTMPVISPILEQNDMTVLHLFWPRSHIVDKRNDPDKLPHQFGFSSGAYSYPQVWIEFLDSLSSDMKPQTFGIAGRNDLYGKDALESFEEFLDSADSDFEIVASEMYDPSSTSLSSIARKIKSADPDVVSANSYMGDCQLFFEGAADVNMDADFLWGNVGPQIPEWIPSMGSAGNYVFGSSPYVYSVPTEANEELYGIAQDEHGTKPHYSYGFGYIQMQIYQQAIEAAGEIDQEALKEQFSSMDFDVVTGNISFSDIQFADAPMYVTQVQDQSIEVVYPEERKTAEPVAPLPGSWPN